MDAKARDLQFILGQPQHWIVPVYQRHYEWETGKDKQITKLWEDLRSKAIEGLGGGGTPYPHYFGAIIYSEPPKQPFGATPKLFLVDGQQRITSFQLVMAAIRENAKTLGLNRLVEVANTYLLNQRHEGMIDPKRECYRLWPSSYDRDIFKNIIDSSPTEIKEKYTPKYFYKNGKLKTGDAPKMLAAFWYLYEEIEKLIAENKSEGHEPSEVIDALLEGFLRGFQIVVIQLDEKDDAQEIFASLNGLGKPLSPFDLIRNDVFHRAQKSNEDNEDLFNNKWKYFETSFWNKQVKQGRIKKARADHLIAHTVVAETGREVNVSKIAAEYIHYSRERNFESIDAELSVLLGYAKAYSAMEEADLGASLGRLAHMLNVWDMSIFHPLVMWVEQYLKEETLRAKLYAFIESYIIRRELCGLTSKNYNKVVTSFLRVLQNSDKPLEELESHIKSLKGEASRMPSNEEVRDACINKDVYEGKSSGRLRYILQQVEYEMRSKFDELTVSTQDLNIEHIMPRSWSDNWPLPDGRYVKFNNSLLADIAGEHLESDVRISIDKRAQLINTLGNLTLVTTSLNPSLSNSGWNEKRPKIAESLLALNRDLTKSENWNEETIKERSKLIASYVNKRWDDNYLR